MVPTVGLGSTVSCLQQRTLSCVCPLSIRKQQPRSKVQSQRATGAARDRSVAAASSSFGDLGLSGSVLQKSSTSSSAPQGSNIDDVPLTSEAGMDYQALRDHLKSKDFRAADDETRALLIKLAGPEAVKRGWVYFTEVQFIPSQDLQTIDALWKTASNNLFGYSVQRELWKQNQELWTRFFKKIDWTTGEYSVYRKWPMEFNYSLDAVKGHLPLTNALRGTQLFKAILEHPAFANSKSSSNGSGKPDWLK